MYALTAARIIRRARQLSGMTDAEFDFMVGHGDRNTVAWTHIDSATYEAANADLPELVPGDGTLQQREDNWKAMRDRLAEEMDRYADRCSTMRFTGWSNAGTGPIRYAD